MPFINSRIINGKNFNAKTHVATLVCDPAAPVLTGEMLRLAAGILASDMASKEPPRWLDQNIAADIFFEPESAASAKAAGGEAARSP